MIFVGKSGNDYMIAVSKRNGTWLKSFGFQWARGFGRPGVWFTKNPEDFAAALRILRRDRIEYTVFREGGKNEQGV